jgi:hypothetical protein
MSRFPQKKLRVQSKLTECEPTEIYLLELIRIYSAEFPSTLKRFGGCTAAAPLERPGKRHLKWFHPSADPTPWDVARNAEPAEGHSPRSAPPCESDQSRFTELSRFGNVRPDFVAAGSLANFPEVGLPNVSAGSACRFLKIT